MAAEMSAWLRTNPAADIAINVPPEIIGRGGIAYVADKSGLIDLAPQIVLEMTERGLPDLLAIETINNPLRPKVRVASNEEP